jgi:hypothetical protein
MIGRQLIDALRGPEPAPAPASKPPMTSLPPTAADTQHMKPPGVLGYAVARYDGPRVVLTHTSPMPLDEARREADAQRAADRSGFGWAVVPIGRPV